MQKVAKITLVLIILTITSCVSKKEIVYFQNDEINQSLENNNYKTVFKSNDLVQITVSALNQEAVKPFNTSFTTDNISGATQQNSYLIGSSWKNRIPYFR